MTHRRPRAAICGITFAALALLGCRGAAPPAPSTPQAEAEAQAQATIGASTAEPTASPPAAPENTSALPSSEATATPGLIEPEVRDFSEVTEAAERLERLAGTIEHETWLDGQTSFLRTELHTDQGTVIREHEMDTTNFRFMTTVVPGEGVPITSESTGQHEFSSLTYIDIAGYERDEINELIQPPVAPSVHERTARILREAGSAENPLPIPDGPFRLATDSYDDIYRHPRAREYEVHGLVELEKTAEAPADGTCVGLAGTRTELRHGVDDREVVSFSPEIELIVDGSPAPPQSLLGWVTQSVRCDLTPLRSRGYWATHEFGSLPGATTPFGLAWFVPQGATVEAISIETRAFLAPARIDRPPVPDLSRSLGSWVDTVSGEFGIVNLESENVTLRVSIDGAALVEAGTTYAPRGTTDCWLITGTMSLSDGERSLELRPERFAVIDAGVDRRASDPRHYDCDRSEADAAGYEPVTFESNEPSSTSAFSFIAHLPAGRSPELVRVVVGPPGALYFEVPPPS